MKKMILFLVTLLAVFFAISYLKNRTAAPAEKGQESLCDMSLWEHVYHGHFVSARDRLEVLNLCVSVSGTVIRARPEADGDWHVQLDLDPEFRSYLNDANLEGQQGYLILEPMCSNRVSQIDTQQEGVCESFAQDLFSPDLIGRRVRVTGAYVRDREHGWNEIHPVTSIVPLG
jgi:hypothetical protein